MIWKLIKLIIQLAVGALLLWLCVVGLTAFPVLAIVLIIIIGETWKQLKK